MQKKIIVRFAVGMLAVVSCAAATFWWWNSDQDRRWGRLRNEYASCANCRSFIEGAIEQYFMETKEEWYPHGGKTPADSLVVLIKWFSSPHHFTSHALSPQLCDYYKKQGTLTYEFMCYRYNEGLRKDDPNGLVLMYYFEPTRWECSYHKKDFVGRPVLSIGSMTWEFISEQSFQEAQRTTEDYLRERNRITKPSTATE